MLGGRLEYQEVCQGQWTAMTKLDVQIWRELIFSVMTLKIWGAGTEPNSGSNHVSVQYWFLTLGCNKWSSWAETKHQISRLFKKRNTQMWDYLWLKPKSINKTDWMGSCILLFLFSPVSVGSDRIISHLCLSIDAEIFIWLHHDMFIVPADKCRSHTRLSLADGGHNPDSYLLETHLHNNSAHLMKLEHDPLALIREAKGQVSNH